MRIINSDGSEAEMCGNGARCAAKFAQIKSIAEKEMTIETISGIVKANVKEKEVKISINNPINIELSQNLEINSEKILFHFINTGVPHTIIILEDIEKIDLRDLGRKIRFHQRFAPSGTNVDLAKIINNNEIYIRTYERGVEDETLSCGTGAIACACISYLLGKVAPPIKVITKSKEYLIVDFEEEFKNLTMEGPVRVIYEGKIYL
jgi:diaminopimelate epimerase